MLTKNVRNHFSAIAGVSLVELMVTMLIGGIAISGMVVAYCDGLQLWGRSSEKMVLYSEGTSVLSLIERFVRQSSYINTYTPNHQPSPRMDLRVLVFDGNVIDEKIAQFYYSSSDNTLRWNNITGENGVFGDRLLPQFIFRLAAGEDPYLQIQKATFTPVDSIPSISPSLDGYASIRVDLVLKDARGDTLALTSLVSRRNRSD
jgi:hypothetical protein